MLSFHNFIGKSIDAFIVLYTITSIDIADMILIGNCIFLEFRLRIEKLILALLKYIAGFDVKHGGRCLLLTRKIFIFKFFQKT
jgi:hypothetical protein